MIGEACKTGQIWGNNSIALKAIENGAVAYIGSIKVGVSSAISNSYLYSHNKATIGTLVLLNNEKIIDTMDNIPRAILIGDPMWYMYENIIEYHNEKYKINLPNVFEGKFAMALDVENKDKIAKAARIDQNGKKEYYNLEKLKGNLNYIYVTDLELKDTNVEIVLLENKPFSLMFTNFMAYLIKSISIIFIIIPIQAPFIGVIEIIILLFLNMNSKEKKTIKNKGKVIYFICAAFTLLLALISKFLLGQAIIIVNLVLHYMLFYRMLFTESFFNRQIVYLTLPTIVLIFLVYFGQKKVFFTYGIVSIIGFGIIINMLITIIRKFVEINW